MLGIEKATVKKSGSDAPACILDADCEPDCEDPSACLDAEQPCPEGGCGAGDADVDSDAGVDADAGEGGDGRCQENAMRCEGTALPTRLQCIEGAWRSAAACPDGHLCDSQAVVAGECKPAVDLCLGQTPGQGFCVGSERIVCGPDLVSATSKSCGTSMLCSLGHGADCAACMPKEWRCEGDTLLRCKEDNSGFEEVETCNAGECRANLGRCTSMLCEPTAYSCEGKVLQRCDSTGMAYVEAERKDCGSGSCDALHGQCDACEADATLGCADRASQTICAPDGQTTTTRACTELSPTTPTCVGAGVCVQCAPNSKSCTDARTLLTCSGQGLPTSSSCTGTTCVAERGCVGECAPMQGKCVGEASTGRMLCGPEGSYIASEACGSGSLCDRESGECKPIIDGCVGRQPGDAVCVGATRIVCGPDLVSASSTEQCGSAELCAASRGASCAECTDDTFECRGAELWGCNTARTGLEKKETCASQDLCKPALGRCTAQVCEPDTYYCTGANSNTLQRCNADGSAYLAGTPCNDGICDAAGGQCDVCQRNTYTGCSGANNRLKCSDDGQTTTPEACPSGTPLCAGAGRCVQCTGASCSADLKTAYSCNDGVQSGTQCAADKTCVGGACSGSCGPGQVQCPLPESPNRQVCGPQGSFVATTACGSGQNCERASRTCKAIVPACAGHKEGDWVCNGVDRIQCGRDLVSIAASGQRCSSAALCNAGTGSSCAPCADGVTPDRCNQAQPETCSGNVWVPKGAACASAVWCTGAGVCSNPTCQPGSWRCKSDGKGHEQCNAQGTGYSTNTDVCGWCNPANPAGCYACRPGVTLGPTCASSTQQSVCGASGMDYSAVQSCGPAPRTLCTGANQCVQCTASVCQSNAILRECVAGLFSNKDCAALDRTCGTGSSGPACLGQCAFDEMRCNPSSKNPEKCVGGGVWQQTELCAVPAQICRQLSETSAVCQTNTPQPYGGHTTNPSDGWFEWAVDTGWAYFIPIVPPVSATLDRFHVRAFAAGGTCRMALYASASGGGPGTLMAKTFQVMSISASGVNSMAPDAPVTLNANATHWVAMRCSNARLYQRDLTGATYYRYMTSAEFASNPPAELRTGLGLSFFITAQQIP